MAFKISETRESRSREKELDSKGNGPDRLYGPRLGSASTQRGNGF